VSEMRYDEDLQADVWPVLLQLGGEPPKEIGVIMGGAGPEQVLVDLAAMLHTVADVMIDNGDDIIAAGRERIEQQNRAAVRVLNCAHDRPLVMACEMCDRGRG
jgi:hypothetical protein